MASNEYDDEALAAAERMRARLEEDGGAAFPAPSVKFTGRDGLDRVILGTVGMSLRDYFAGQALAGTIAQDDANGVPTDMIVGAAYGTADAMLEARDRDVE